MTRYDRRNLLVGAASTLGFLLSLWLAFELGLWLSHLF